MNWNSREEKSEVSVKGISSVSVKRIQRRVHLVWFLELKDRVHKSVIVLGRKICASQDVHAGAYLVGSWVGPE